MIVNIAYRSDSAAAISQTAESEFGNRFVVTFSETTDDGDVKITRGQTGPD